MVERNAPPDAEDDLSLRPWTEDDDLTGWEVVADSSNTEIAFAYTVSFTPEETRLIIAARRNGCLDVFAVAKSAVLERARALADQKATAAP
jgi:hypothetical protein